MGVTYTAHRDRDLRPGRRFGRLRRGEWVLAATSMVSVLAIALAVAGRLRAFDATEQPRAAMVRVNLADVTKAESLEPAMALTFEQPADRRFAAKELLASLFVKGERAPIANVGAIARIQVPAAVIEKTPRLPVLSRRLEDARKTAAAAGDPPPDAIPLFTGADLSSVKPALVVRTREEHRRVVLWCALAFLVAFQLVSLVWRFRGAPGDHVLLSAAHVLTTLGFVVILSRPDPLRDTMMIVRYTEGVVFALALFLIASFANLRTASFLRLSYVPLLGALVLSAALIVFGSGPGTSGAKVNLGPVQPIEAIRLLLALFLAGYFARRWEFLRQLRGDEIRNRKMPAWLNLPRADHMLPVLAGVGVALALFFLQRDLGPALLLSLMFLSMFAVARAGVGMAAVGLSLLSAGFYLGYQLGISSTLTARVAMWQSPWDNAVRRGDQLAQAAWAMATGATAGTGLGLGDTRFLPAGHTDLVLAAVGEELGAVGVLVVVAMCAIVAWRGLRIARAASTDYGFFLALAMVLSLAIPALVMGAGVLGVIPLTGVVTPFLSYGGSAMAANFAALGLLVAVGSGSGGRPAAKERRDPGAAADAQPFNPPLRWLSGALAASAIGLVAVWAPVQVLRADEYIVKPQLSVQADGGRRYQFNPRVLDVARVIPRGTVFDRRGLPIASDNSVAIQTARAEYDRMRVSIRDVCPTPGQRCYPLGGAAFHLIGDARTRSNWSASNTSYVERDDEDSLRGFDDRAVAVRVDDAAGRAAIAVRRDHRDLIPLVRHRWEPDHPAVKALLARSRDVQLTIDARLQHDVAGIIAKAAASAGIMRAAAVVLDAATGDVLASVSYPWPGPAAASAADVDDAVFDRARYGLYPPGSTFKLVTAAAALQQNLELKQLSFTCSRLSGDRIGVRIPGGRPVRDDVHDSQPHGTIAMHDGLVRSCNAYFAQLAMRLGPDALTRTASVAGIMVSPPGASRARIMEQLPHAGYGQGDVLTTPLRMARVAAAIASDGMIREAPIAQKSAEPSTSAFLSGEAARLLGNYMRDAVTGGTGRLLAGHAGRIAGKTGTAEVDDAASHAWFVGYAPHGPASRRIAFAVLLENAGYGGTTAASVAGQIVTAAGTIGVAK